jgi:hypothetical protein
MDWVLIKNGFYCAFFHGSGQLLLRNAALIAAPAAKIPANACKAWARCLISAFHFARRKPPIVPDVGN